MMNFTTAHTRMMKDAFSTVDINRSAKQNGLYHSNINAEIATISSIPSNHILWFAIFQEVFVKQLVTVTI